MNEDRHTLILTEADSRFSYLSAVKPSQYDLQDYTINEKINNQTVQKYLISLVIFIQGANKIRQK